MTDGEISGNTSSYGGGVYIYYLDTSNYGIFTKTGGTIYGYVEGDDNSNVVKDNSGNVLNNRGHAVYITSSPVKRMEITAGPLVILDSRVSR